MGGVRPNAPTAPVHPHRSGHSNNRTSVLILSRGKCRGEWFTAENAEFAEKRECKLEVKSAEEGHPPLADSPCSEGVDAAWAIRKQALLQALEES